MQFSFTTKCSQLYSYSVEDPQSFSEKVGFWINNIQLKVPNSVVLMVGTHTDLCQDGMEVLQKKNDIEEKVRHMLSERKESLKRQRRNLEELEDHSLFSEQMSDLERLTEYKLKVGLRHQFLDAVRFSFERFRTDSPNITIRPLYGLNV